ncbi:50S ribosomal protein L37ae [Thermoproteus tenax]|uniref:Large ribosomal subunit protein eL43 n=1 Tax=Thermoproteus tenax (strain ATCC 35583 / DSM 2078 / JCM 9277 / NBRC 100435 / Kra 1) TaxID=768679 RepID=G4RPI0_THETK|nr:50S ribosomal protein L37ae [Thermoproteus tenax]CCC81475.1 50S ribosomal protein L37ae [Thermoproteus tenax Kra 1]
MPYSHTKVVGPAGRYGTRYGMGLRRKVITIETKQRGIHRCPNCRSLVRLKRLAFGIWQCPKCGFTFAGGAWTPQTILGRTLTPEELKQVEAQKAKWRGVSQTPSE